MSDKDPEIRVPVLEPADVHSVDIKTKLRFFLKLLLFSKQLSK